MFGSIKSIGSNLFNNENFLKTKAKQIERDISNYLIGIGIESSVYSFGAYDIDPKHFVVVVAVLTDEIKNKIQATDEIQLSLNSFFISNNWPKPKVSTGELPAIEVESNETVNRDFAGNWYYRFK